MSAGGGLAVLLRRAVERHGERTAVIEPPSIHHTFSSLWTTASSRAAWLADVGSPRVAVALPPGADALAWWLAGLAAASALTFVDTGFAGGNRGRDDVTAELELFAPDVVVAPADGDVGPGVDVLPASRRPPVPCVAPGTTVLGRARRRAHRPDRRSIVVFSSGTTGAPKAVVHSDRTLGRSLAVTARLDREPPAERVFLNGMPPSTISGVMVLLRALLSGATSVVPESFTAEGFLDLIEAHAVTDLSLSPHMAQAVLRQQARSPRAVGSVSATGLGAGPTPPGLCVRFEREVGGLVAVGYGMTETGGPALMARYEDDAETRHATVGRPAPGVAATVRSAEPDTPGELLLRHPALAHGYLEQSGRVAPLPLADGWYPTGDLALRRGDGAYVLYGRRSGLIVRGGANIDPVRIERVLEASDAVERAAVVGVPSRVAGEENVCAVLELTHGDVDLTRLRVDCVRQLGPRSAPQRLVVVDRLPRTADRDVNRAAVRAMLFGDR